MKNEIRVSRLMDAYTDNEFFIQGESEVDLDMVKKNVAEQAAGAKRKMKPLFKVLIGVAAAAVLAGGAAAVTIPMVLKGSQDTTAGGAYNFEIRDGGYRMTLNSADYSKLLRLEDGRLYFNINDETTDITDLIDRETPYICAYTNTQTGGRDYIIMGGTPEQYAIIDLTYIEEAGIGWRGHGSLNGIDGNIVNLNDYSDVNDSGNVIDFSISQNFVRDGDGVHIVAGTEEEFHHQHSILWTGDTINSNDIPENWEDECMDAWLIKALVQLEIIPEC